MVAVQAFIGIINDSDVGVLHRPEGSTSIAYDHWDGLLPCDVFQL